MPNLARSNLPLLLSQRLSRIRRMKTSRPLLFAAQIGLIHLAFLLALPNGYAGSATWSLNPTNGDWNTAANWMPNTVPNGPDDTATFAASNQTDISLSLGTQVNGVVFSPGASAFTISANPRSSLSITGTGIVNNSGVVQRFVCVADTEVDGVGGGVFFSGSATAGNGTFITEGGAVSGGFVPGKIILSGTATAGNASFITNVGQVAGADAGYVQFRDSTTADHGTFTTNGTEGDFNSRGITDFTNTSSGGDAIFTNAGSPVTGGFGGATIFSDSSTAANATLIAEPGEGEGGSVEFYLSADGGTARVDLSGNGQLDISCHSDPGMTIGSIEGTGNIFLGSHNLAAGSNNLSTVFSGLIQDAGGFCGGTGGSLTKIGTGKLVLANANTYTGGTAVEEGALVVNNRSDSGTGSGAVQIHAGTLAGRGTIAGPVTVGTGAGAGAVLSPGKGSLKPRTLNIQGAIIFNSDATYKVDLNSRHAVADKVAAKGVTIDGSALFSFNPHTGGSLSPGTVFTVIDNTAATPISGTFSNLADGQVIVTNGNNFQADYQGGDGNDLTLTVVP